MKGFKDVTAYIHGKGIVKTNIGIENNKIVYIGDNSLNIEEICKVDGIMVAGFIDEHTHGAGGYDAMDGTKIALEEISKTLCIEGTTAFLATTMTQNLECINTSLKTISSLINKDLGGATLLGTHLEGPFISSKYKGAQSKNFIQKPSIKLMQDFIKVSRETIKLVTYAPELDTNGEFTKLLVKNNIIPSAGHSDASYDDIKKSIDNGLKCVTHTFNAQSPIHHRNIGLAGSALLFNNLATEIICDGIHLSIPVINLLIKNKPKDKVILITDSIRAKGIDENISELGGQKVFINNSRATLSDGTLAGSILKMNDAIKLLVTQANVSFEDAVDFASYNPAKNLNLLDTMGIIKENNLANLTVINSNFEITMTMVNGKIVYQK